MEILKRVINLIYAILIIGLGIFAFFFVGVIDWVSFFTGIGMLSLIFGVINFALFKKFTVWNE